MKNPKTILALLLAAATLTAWAGNDAAAERPRSNKDNGAAVTQAQPARDDDKPDQETQSKPKADQAPKSKDRDARPTEHRSNDAPPARSEPSSAPATQRKPETIRVPASAETKERDYTEPVRIKTERSGRASGEAGQSNVLPAGGDHRGPRGGRGHGGYRGRHGHDPFDRRPSHFFGGHRWHGRHDEWRHKHFHGSWRFLFHLGPVIYFPPIHYPHVIRIPHERVGVYVRHTGEDAAGAEFANAVRQQLREEGLRVVYSQDDARLELYVISMEQDPDEPGYGSAISVSYVWYPGHRFITAQMVDAGLDEIDDLAASVAAYADDLVDDYR